MELHFDALDVEMGDLDVFEELTGCKFDDFDWKGQHGAAEMKAIYFLVMRQNDPEFTPDKLVKVKLRELIDVAEAVERAGPDPTVSGGES